jgi:hypothetical protein
LARGQVLAVVVIAAVLAALVPALGATAASVSRGSAGLPQVAAYVGFRAQGGEHGAAGRTVQMSSVPALRHADGKTGPGWPCRWGPGPHLPATPPSRPPHEPAVLPRARHRQLLPPLPQVLRLHASTQTPSLRHPAE